MTNHGHVTPNPDGSKARCGGPSICTQCATELAATGQPLPPGTGTGTGWPDETPAPTATGFIPQRGDAVERWIRQARDRQWGISDPSWDALNDLLDDYRDHADTGTTLDQEVTGPTGPGEQ